MISDMGLAKEMAALLIRGKKLLPGEPEKDSSFRKNRPFRNSCDSGRRKARMGNQGTYGLQSHKVTENRKKPWEQSRLGCFICIRKMCISGWVCRKNHTGRKDRNTDSEVSVRTWNSCRTDYPGSQHRSEKNEEPGLLAFCEKISPSFCDLSWRRT